LLNGDLIMQRLSQYAAVWVLAFTVVLTGALGARYGFGLDLIDTADILLPAAFAVLGLLAAAFLVITLFDKQTILTHIVVVVGGLLLILPLLWSPVLAVIFAAWIAKVSIEYSTAYAQFRITISDLIYPISQFLFGPALSSAWLFFQGLASVVGVLSAMRQIFLAWRALTRGGSEPVPEGV
jgi:hypothetical protein